jgi:GDP-mannose 6-dehydrogenase
MTATYDVCVLGLGPVGTVSAACYAKQGFSVMGIDINPARIHALKDGRAPFAEPGLNELVKEVCASGELEVSQDYGHIAHARIVMIAVGTPTGDVPDLSQLDKVCEQVGEALKHKTTDPVIVVRSTVPPGTIRHRLTGIIESASGLRAGEDFHMASNPEFLREGTAIKDFFKTGRIIVGADDPEIAQRIADLYPQVEAASRMHVSIEAAEFAKYVDNTWHALKVSFANEIGRVCQAFGGHIEETAQIFLSDRQLNVSPNYLKPGFAFGGSCLPKDVRGLAWLAETLGVSAPVINAILPSNEAQITLGMAAILEQRPQQVGLLGVAFKEHVDDLRESPALTIAAELMRHGIRVVAHDASYKPGDLLTLPRNGHGLQMTDMETLARDSDTLVIMHRLPEYFTLAEKHPGKPAIDLTTFPPPTNDYGKETVTLAKSAR